VFVLVFLNLICAGRKQCCFNEHSWYIQTHDVTFCEIGYATYPEHFFKW